MAKESYHFLLTAMSAYGPVNATMGFGELLIRHGHEVTFTHLSKYRKAAEARGFGFIDFDEKIFPSEVEDSLVETMDRAAENLRKNPIERFVNMTDFEKTKLAGMVNEWRRLEAAIGAVIAQHGHQFDALVHDWCDLTGSLFTSKHPVISLQSANPLLIYQNGPPYTFGLSLKDKDIWDKVTQSYLEAHTYHAEQVNKMLVEFGREPFFDPLHWISPVKTLGFYHFPAELDYDEYMPRAEKWHRIDCFIRSPDPGTFEIPSTLKHKPGKLIYFSLGSTASNDLVTMRKVLAALAKSPHRFIVSKGFRGDQLELSDNMWGDKYVNQIAIIQSVDLVITHGGNNTLMEALYFAKPMIVIPYFFDQPDNAQRVVDKGIGYRVNPWDFDEDYLFQCIEQALTNSTMHDRIKSISESMKKSDSGKKAIEMIEEAIKSTKSN